MKIDVKIYKKFKVKPNKTFFIQDVIGLRGPNRKYFKGSPHSTLAAKGVLQSTLGVNVWGPFIIPGIFSGPINEPYMLKGSLNQARLLKGASCSNIDCQNGNLITIGRITCLIIALTETIRYHQKPLHPTLRKLGLGWTPCNKRILCKYMHAYPLLKFHSSNHKNSKLVRASFQSEK